MKTTLRSKEEWKDINGYENIYQISSLGRVRSLDRTGCTGRKLKGRILRPSSHKGNLQVLLYRDGERTKFQVKRLFVKTFLNLQLNKNMVVTCKDGCSFTINKENIIVKPKNIHTINSNSSRWDTKPLILEKIVKDISEKGRSMSDIAREHGVYPSTIYRFLRRYI